MLQHLAHGAICVLLLKVLLAPGSNTWILKHTSGFWSSYAAPKTHKLWIKWLPDCQAAPFLDPAQKVPHHPSQHRLIGHYNNGTYILMFSLNRFISKDFFRRPFSLGMVASPQPLPATLPSPSPSFPPSFHFANQPTVHNGGVSRGIVIAHCSYHHIERFSVSCMQNFQSIGPLGRCFL